MPNKFFIYARKSTDVEDMQILSIEAQLTELRELAKKEGLEIVDELIEKKSAKVPGREIFNSMLNRIEKEEANGIISWHPDRLARNSVDGGRIIYLLDRGKLSALKFNTFWFEPTPQGKFMLNIAFSQSKYYVDSLSENTKRGLRQKARNGYMPSVAPIGYLNDSRSKTVVINKKVGQIIKEAFEYYSSGNVLMREVSGFLAKKGILHPNGKYFSVTRIRKILTNSYYYGHFVYAGEVYEGRQGPIISKQLFDKVQEIINRKNKQWSKARVERIHKPYLGLLRCGECGMMITGEIRTKHYKSGECDIFRYYHCTKKSKIVKCSQSHYTREESIGSQLTTLLKKYSLKKDWAIKINKKIDEEQEDIAQSSLSVISLKRKEIDNLNSKLQLLLDSYLDQITDKEMYKEKKLELVGKRKTLEEQIINLQKQKGSWIEPMRNWISEASEVDQIISGDEKDDKKALALKIFGSNLYLENKKVRGEGLNQWSALRADPTSRKWEPMGGIEPPTLALRKLRSTKLSYIGRWLRLYHFIALPLTILKPCDL